MSRRLHRRGLQFLTPLIVAGAAAQLADEGDGARDYEREYEQGFTEASADKQERALEVIEIIAMLENVTLEAVGRTLAAFVVAHAAVLTTIAIVVCCPIFAMFVAAGKADEPKQPISRRKRNDRYYSSSKYD